MKYFKHSELAERYRVSLKTVHNWIDAAKQGKAELKLHTTASNRTYIADTPGNVLTLEKLAEKGKKFRNTLHHQVIHPKPEFYEIYNQRQILDLITNLDVYGEIPRQYNYFKDGATYWDKWIKQHVDDQAPNILKATVDLLRENLDAIYRLAEKSKKINIIDLGAGNAFPVRELLGDLSKKGLLNRYIAIDFSPAMLDVARQNVHEWYGDSVKFEGYARDISYEHFDDLIVSDMLDSDTDHTINIVLLLGGTAKNLRSYEDVFKAAHSSMSGKDLMVYVDKPDTEASRRYFDLPDHTFILNFLNIDESLYDIEMGFDPDKRMRYVYMCLKKAITLKFEFEDLHRKVNLEKGDRILLMRIRHVETLEIISSFAKVGFSLVHSSLTKDRQFFLSILAVEAKQSQQDQQ